MGMPVLANLQPLRRLLHYLCDALDAEMAVNGGVFVFVVIGDALKIFLEQELDGVDSSWPVHCLRDRCELQG